LGKKKATDGGETWKGAWPKFKTLGSSLKPRRARGGGSLGRVDESLHEPLVEKKGRSRGKDGKAVRESIGKSFAKGCLSQEDAPIEKDMWESQGFASGVSSRKLTHLMVF